MKIKSILAVALAATVALASCSKENGEPAVSGEASRMVVKITTSGTKSRAISDNSGNAELTLVGGKIMWSNLNGKITRVVTVASDADYTAATDDAKKNLVKLSELTGATGSAVQDVMEDSKVCTFIGAHAATGMPDPLLNANISNVKKAYFTIDKIADETEVISNVPIYGADETLVVDKTTDPANPVIIAEFNVEAIGSRIQIESVKGGEGVKSFKIAGIWINNFISKMAYDKAPLATDIIDNEDDDTKYNASYDGHSAYLADVDAGSGLGFSADNLVWIPVKDETKYWAYNVFPNIGLTKAELPHVIIKLVNLIDTADTNHGTKFITVKGYVDENSQPINNFAGGNSYTFGGSKGLTFNIDDVTDKPEQKAILGQVTIEAIDWVDNTVTPEF